MEFNSHKFLLIDADEYALKYMEKYFQQVCVKLDVCSRMYVCMYVLGLGIGCNFLIDYQYILTD